MKKISKLLFILPALILGSCESSLDESGKAPTQPGEQNFEEPTIEYEAGNSMFYSLSGASQTVVDDSSPYKDFVTEHKYSSSLIRDRALSFKFYLDKEHEINIGLYISANTEDKTKFNEMFKIILNDNDISSSSTLEVPNPKKVDNYFVKTDISGNANEGANILAVIPLNKSNGFCGVEINTGESTCHIYKKDPNPHYGTPYELDVDGEFDGDGEYGASIDSPERAYVVEHDYAGEMHAGGKSFNLKFYSASEQDVIIDLILAGSDVGNVTLNTLYTVNLNGVEIDTSTIIVSNPNKVKYVYFDSASFNATIPQGNTSLLITAKVGATNFSGIRVTPKDENKVIEDYKDIPVPGLKKFECEENVKLEGNSNNMNYHMIANNCVSYFGGTTGQKLTYKVMSDANATVNGTLNAAPYNSAKYTDSDKPNQTISFKVNGVKVTFEETQLQGITTSSYETYHLLHFSSNLVAGENIITIESLGPVNLDYFTFDPGNTVVIKPIIPYEDAVQYECEHIDSVGNYTVPKGQSKFDTGGASSATLDGNAYTTSNGYNLGYFNSNNCYAIYRVLANKEGDVIIKLRVSVYGDTTSVDAKDLCGVLVNNESVSIESKTISNIKTNSYQQYTDVTIKAKFKNGINSIRFTRTVNNFNLDCFSIAPESDSTLKLLQYWGAR